MDLAYHLVLIAGCGHLAAQLVKCILARKLVYLSDGGMPSGHAATVSALAAGTLFLDGPRVAFGIAVILAVIVMHDALRIRSEVGAHARVLNALQKRVKFKEDTGHVLSEVVVGAVIGVIVAWLYVLVFL